MGGGSTEFGALQELVTGAGGSNPAPVESQVFNPKTEPHRRQERGDRLPERGPFPAGCPRTDPGKGHVRPEASLPGGQPLLRQRRLQAIPEPFQPFKVTADRRGEDAPPRSESQ